MGLTAAATEIPTIIENDGEITGPYAVIYEALKFKINVSFDVTFIGYVDMGKIYSEKNGTGILGSLIRNESQFSIIPSFLNEKAIEFLDYTAILSDQDFHIVSGPARYFIKSYFQSVWVSLIVAILVYAISWVLLRACSNFPTTNSTRTRVKMFEDTFCKIFAILMNQGVQIQPRLYERLFWIAWITAGYCLTLSFLAVMFSKLAKRDSPFRYETIKDFTIQPDIELLMIKDTPPYLNLKNSENPVKMQVWKKMEDDKSAKSFEELDFMDTVSKIKQGKLAIMLIPRVFLLISTMVCGEVQDIYISKETYISTMLPLLMRRDLDISIKKMINFVAYQFMETKLLAGKITTLCDIGRLCLLESEIERNPPISLDRLYFILIVYLLSLSIAIICGAFELIIKYYG